MGASKWITGGLGFVLAGPIGGIIGLAAGYLIEEMAKGDNFIPPGGQQQRTSSTRRGDFTLSFLVLIAAVMKADGKVLKSELDFVKQYLLKMYGEVHARDAVRTLGDILKQHIPIQDVSRQIRHNMDYDSRVQLTHLLFAVAAADGHVSSIEVDTIKMIAGAMGISPNDWTSIKAMFVTDQHWAYKILEVDPNASNEEIKKAYRKMAVKFHPDKVAHLGEEYQTQAKEKFQKVNQAYEELKKQKNLN